MVGWPTVGLPAPPQSQPSAGTLIWKAPDAELAGAVDASGASLV